MWRYPLSILVVAGLHLGCQDWEYVYQPDVKREGSELAFTVEQPSRADILFVVDNSRTMEAEQQALKASVAQMLKFLAPQDTSYRIGIISTDARGRDTDCCGYPIPPGFPGDLNPTGNSGNCQSCQCVTMDTMDAITDCKNCKAVLKPLAGDCCVYCSYGDVKCPPIQEGDSCCA